MTDRPDVATLPLPQDRLERYVLGLLEEAEREAIEARAFSELDVATAIDAAETDLVDDWVADRLDQPYRDAFARALAERPRLRTRVDLAQAFHARGAHRPPEDVPDVPPRRNARSSWLIGLAAAAMVIVSTAFWFARSTDHPAGPQETSARDERSRDAEVAPPKLVPAPPQSPSAVPPSPTPARVLFAVRLPGATTRSATVTRVAIPEEATHVQVSMPVADGDDFAGYRLAISDGAGRAVAAFDRQSLAAGRLVVGVVPRSALGNGLHEVTLTGRTSDGTEEPLAIVQIEVVTAPRS